MPHKKPVPKLTELCLQSTCNFFPKLQDEINSLPNCLIASLHERYSELTEPGSPNTHLPPKLFINRGTTYLNLRKIRQPVHQLVEQIGAICTNLTHIKWRFCYNVLPAHLTALVRNVPQILSIDFSNSSIDDDVLAAIGTYCPRLQYLKVNHCKNVSDDGILFMCANSFAASGGSKIEHLDIWDTSVTPDGALGALERLPSLKELEYDLWDELFQLLELEYSCTKRTYTLQQLSMTFWNKIELDLATKIFPDLMCILAENRPNIFGLEVDINSALINTKRNLTSMTLSCVWDVDVQMIGFLCPRLENLNLKNCCHSCGSEVELVNPYDHVPFKNLRVLHLRVLENTYFPEMFLRMLLANCSCLEQLFIMQCRSLTDGLVEDVIQSNGLNRLKYLTLTACSSITSRSIMRLLEIDNPLVYFSVTNCGNVSSYDWEKMEAYIQYENFNLTFYHS